MCLCQCAYSLCVWSTHTFTNCWHPQVLRDGYLRTRCCASWLWCCLSSLCCLGVPAGLALTKSFGTLRTRYSIAACASALTFVALHALGVARRCQIAQKLIVNVFTDRHPLEFGKLLLTLPFPLFLLFLLPLLSRRLAELRLMCRCCDLLVEKNLGFWNIKVLKVNY